MGASVFKKTSFENISTFYNAVVKPHLSREFPRLKYSVALMGDEAREMLLTRDTSPPHLQFFLNETDFETAQLALSSLLEQELAGRHEAVYTYHTPTSFYHHYLDYNPFKKISTRDWLSFSQPALAQVSYGEVFEDGLKKLHFLKDKFAYYPDDVWLYLYLKEWQEVGSEGLTQGQILAADELTAELYLNRIAVQVIRLSFMLEKKYIPSIKYLGSEFSKLAIARQLSPFLTVEIQHNSLHQRIEAVTTMYQILMRKHNENSTISVSEKNQSTSEFFMSAEEIISVISNQLDPTFYRRLTYKQ